MLILALDQCTADASLALLRDGTVLETRTWTDTRSRTQRLFDEIPDLLASHDTGPDQLDAFAVDLGPGNYAGLRISLSAARGMSLPGGKPVWGVSSGEVLAASRLAQDDVATVVAAGDARRGRVWIGRFTRGETGPVLMEDYRLLPMAELPGFDFGPDAVLVTPDWDRIGAELRGLSLPAVRIEGTACRPSADDVARIAWRKAQAGRPRPPRSS